MRSRRGLAIPDADLRSLQGDQGDVVLLLPFFAREAGQLDQHKVDELLAATRLVGQGQLSKPREAEHLALWVVCLYQPITVEQEVVPLGENDFFLLVEHARHQSERHPSRPQLVDLSVVSPAGGVVAGVGVDETAALWVEDAIEAGDERAWRDVGIQDLVGLRQHLPWSDVPSSGDGTKHALGVGHHQRRRNTLAGDIAYDEAYTAVLQAEEVVEVATHLSCGLVTVGQLPALELGQVLRVKGMLDAPCLP